MLKFLTKSRDLIAESDALPGRDESHPRPRQAHRARHAARCRPSPRGSRSCSSASAASGAPSASSGSSRASTRRPSATRAASRRTRRYAEVCSGRTGHTEAVLVAYDPKVLPFEQLLRTFWEGHDPTQGMRQGNDMGTQYRSAIYWTTDAQREIALRSRDAYQAALSERGRGQITTELARGRPVLPGRGVPPAVPAEEPGRLLRPRRHGRELPDRRRRQRRVVARCTIGVRPRSCSVSTLDAPAALQGPLAGQRGRERRGRLRRACRRRRSDRRRAPRPGSAPCRARSDAPERRSTGAPSAMPVAWNSGSSTQSTRAAVADHLELVGAREPGALPDHLDGRDARRARARA